MATPLLGDSFTNKLYPCMQNSETKTEDLFWGIIYVSAIISGFFSFTNSMNSHILFNKQSTVVYIITMQCATLGQPVLFAGTCPMGQFRGFICLAFLLTICSPYYQICLPLCHPPEQINLQFSVFGSLPRYLCTLCFQTQTHRSVCIRSSLSQILMLPIE